MTGEADIVDTDPVDLAVIGGGINGTGIARDAAGRGHSVFLCEQGDLGSGTSSASTKLIHGGLRYLEYYEFRLVREALREREVLWALAPHIVWPLRFVLPYRSGLRPAWLLRLGLFLYDNIGGRRRLLPTRTLDLTKDPAGRPLKPGPTRGFEYSDCWVEDSRLVVLNARDAADRGAEIAVRTRCVSAQREGLLYWRLLVAGPQGTRTVHARALVNATGPWIGRVAGEVIRADAPASVRLVQGSHVVTRRLYDGDQAYIFQNPDKRIFFVVPYERDFTLIGTTDREFDGDPSNVQPDGEEIAYICRSATEWLRTPVTPADVVWSYAGVRPLFDDGTGTAQSATRDYVLKLDAAGGAPPLLSIYGGKITTYRRLAEAALAQLTPHIPPRTGEAPGWTGRLPLPGGNFPADGFDRLVADAATRFPFLPEPTLRRLIRAYGTRIDLLLDGVTDPSGLGRTYGADLTDAELRYLAAHEWARTAEDVVWRRTKLGLRLTAGQIATVDQALTAVRQTMSTAA